MTKHSAWGTGIMLASICCIGASPPAAAQESAKFKPSAHAGYVYDSNLFRLSSAEEAQAVLGTSDRDVGALQYGGGLEVGIPVSRQYLELDVAATRSEYDAFEYLDHTALSARGRWGWNYGALWSGDLRLRYRRDIAPFEEFDQPVKDTRTLRDVHLDATRRLTPWWDLGFSAGHSEFEHGLASRESLNRDVNMGAIELIRLGSAPDSRAGLRFQHRRVLYRNPEVVAGTPVDNSHTEQELAADLHWEATARSALSAQLGYAVLRHDEFSERDFSGPVGTLKYHYQLTERSGAEASAWRDLTARPNSSASYVDETGAGLRAFWLYGDRVSLDGFASFETRRFEGDPGLGVADLTTRRDEVRALQLSLSYAQYDYLLYKLIYTSETLESNRRDRNYRYHAFAGSIELTF